LLDLAFYQTQTIAQETPRAAAHQQTNENIFFFAFLCTSAPLRQIIFIRGLLWLKAEVSFSQQ
jgi:hypothetical protein